MSSNYGGRGKRRYNNGYGGHKNGSRGGDRRSHSNRFRADNNGNNGGGAGMNNMNNMNGMNKPFRILQRREPDPESTGVGLHNNNNNSTVNANAVAHHHSPPSHTANVASSPPLTAANVDIMAANLEAANETGGGYDGDDMLPVDNIALVLQNVIGDDESPLRMAHLGHQLLGMQKRGGRLYHYKRKDGVGPVISIPAHHKKNYNKSIGRGKKFDKEREAAMQAMQGSNPDLIGTSNEEIASNVANAILDSQLVSNSVANTATATSTVGATGALTCDSTTTLTAPESVIVAEALSQTNHDNDNDHDHDNDNDSSNMEEMRTWRNPANTASGAATATATATGTVIPSQHQQQPQQRPFRERMGRGGGGGGRGRGRRGKGFGGGNSYYASARFKSAQSNETWSDDEDYNRGPRKSKFEPPRHRACASNAIMDAFHHEDGGGGGTGGRQQSPLPFSNDDDSASMHSPNVGPRHRQYKYGAGGPPAGPPAADVNDIDVYWDSDRDREYRDRGRDLNDKELLDAFLSGNNSNNNNNHHHNHSSAYASVPFLDVRLCTHVMHDIEKQLTDCTDFVVVGVLGQQGVGKSTILAHLAASEAGRGPPGGGGGGSGSGGAHRSPRRDRGSGQIFAAQDLSKLLSATHGTHGIQCYISRERVIYLDCQPILSSSILFSLTNHRRRCLREKPHENAAASLETWHTEMAKHALFLSCICHVLLVVSDTIADAQTAKFLRSIYAMRQSMKLNSFLRHDSSVRRRIKELQTRMSESAEHNRMVHGNGKMFGGVDSGGGRSGGVSGRKNMKREKQKEKDNAGRFQWKKKGDDDDDDEHEEKGKKKQNNNVDEDEEEDEDDETALLLDTDDFDLYQLLNSQQRYGFPDLVFVQNKVATTQFTPDTFTFERRFLWSMLQHTFVVRHGEIGNTQLLGMLNAHSRSPSLHADSEASLVIPEHVLAGAGGGGNAATVAEQKEKDKDKESEVGEDVDAMAARMNSFFLPRVDSHSKQEFESACAELKHQLLCMAKPQTVSLPNSAAKQTERDWFAYSKKIWHAISNAPNFLEYIHTNS